MKSLAGPLAGGGGATIDPPDVILGGNLVEWLDARVGVTLVGGDVDSWAGSEGLLTVLPPAAPFRPDFGVDGTNFLGLPVVQTDGAAFRTLGVDIGANIFANGSLPYIAVVGRLRTAYTAAATKKLVCVRQAFQAGDLHLTIAPGANDGEARTFAFGSGNSGGLALDTNVHFLEAYYTATGAARFAIDGVDDTAGAGGGTIGTNHSIGIGSVDQSGLFGDDANVAAVILAAAVPDAAGRAALRAWAQAEWGAP